MEYTIKKLAEMSGVSVRTLHYYDEIGLLCPLRAKKNKYRVYNSDEIDRLQQILFYRELGVSLDEIRQLLDAPNCDLEKIMKNHLSKLREKRAKIDLLIQNITKTLQSMKGEIIMTDNEKFEGFTQKLIDENEQKYGTELREKYGDKMIDESNNKMKGMSREQYEESMRLSLEMENTLNAAFESGNPAGELAQKSCELHKQWLCLFYPNYNKEYHMGLAEMYIADERFKAYYEKIAVGCTEFLRDAIKIYCE